ncbi:MAG TPA: hypothetical protein VGH09_09030 [Solirubrobacteraceae bacterium]
MTEDQDQDWRLRVELGATYSRGALDRLLGRVRGPDVAKDVGSAVAHDVVITHDGELLFAYAANEAALGAARSAIESVLRQDNLNPVIVVSHWDDDLYEWHQTDPGLTGEAKRRDDATRRDAEAVETRTMVASSGKEIRAEFEQSMANRAQELGLEYEVIEHPHMLTTQVAFTVTGPKRKIDEFAQGLRAEELATLRTERGVMFSPL